MSISYLYFLPCVLLCGLMRTSAFIRTPTLFNKGLGRLSNEMIVDSSSRGDGSDFFELNNSDPDFITIQNEINDLVQGVGSSVPENQFRELPSANLTRRKNYGIAIFSAMLGVSIFLFQQFQPASGITLLKAMEMDSPDLQTVICNGKPVVIDFFAYWCESCKEVAPSMRAVEKKFQRDLNILSVDASNPVNRGLVSRFRVDGIPHIAFLNKDLKLETSLIGAVPKELLFENIDALVLGKELPVEGMDPFNGESDAAHYRFSDVSNLCPQL